MVGLTSRQPAGAPTGGQFAAGARTEAALGLGAPASVSLVDIVTELQALERDDPAYCDAQWQLRAAIDAYAANTGRDLRGAVFAPEDYPVDVIDPGYNFTPDNSVAEYEARWVASGRLHGEDLEWQVAWYSRLVDGARAGQLPRVLVHETGGKAVIVDGGHRLSAHRAAGLDRVAAYVVRDAPAHPA